MPRRQTLPNMVISLLSDFMAMDVEAKAEVERLHRRQIVPSFAIVWTHWQAEHIPDLHFSHTRSKSCHCLAAILS